MFEMSLEDTQAIVSLISNIASLMGIILFISGVYMFRQNSVNSQAFPIRRAIMYVLTGAFLLSLDTFYGTVIHTAAPDATANSVLAVNKHIGLTGSNEAGSGGVWGLLSDTMTFKVVTFLYVIGFISFVRGLYMMKNVGEGQPGKGFLGGAITHIVYGAALMNLNDLMNFISSNM